jgi:hypothetical protein
VLYDTGHIQKLFMLIGVAMNDQTVRDYIDPKVCGVGQLNYPKRQSFFTEINLIGGHAMLYCSPFRAQRPENCKWGQGQWIAKRS